MERNKDGDYAPVQNDQDDEIVDEEGAEEELPEPPAEENGKKRGKFNWKTKGNRLMYIEALSEHMPEAAAYGMGAQAWDSVKAALENQSGASIGLSTIKQNLTALKKEFKKYDDLTEKSGTSEEVKEVLEAFREYLLKTEERKKMTDEQKLEAQQKEKAGEAQREASLKRLRDKDDFAFQRPAKKAKRDEAAETGGENSDEESASISSSTSKSNRRFSDPLTSITARSLETEKEVEVLRSSTKMKALEVEEKRLALESERFQAEMAERRAEREDRRREEERRREDERQREEERRRAEDRRWEMLLRLIEKK